MGWGIPEQEWRKGPWTPEEDRLLSEYVNLHGEGRWSSVSRCTGKIHTAFAMLRDTESKREREGNFDQVLLILNDVLRYILFVQINKFSTLKN